MVRPGLLDWRGVAKVMSERPAQIVGLDDQGRPLAVGEPANVVLVDPDTEWTVSGPDLASISHNTPYDAMTLPGKGHGHGAARTDHRPRRRGVPASRRRVGALMDRILLTLIFVALWLVLVLLMWKGWRSRARRQADVVGELPALPDDLGDELIAPSSGLYVGSTLAPSWQDRIAVGDLGHRAVSELSRHTKGILLSRTGEMPIWIPQDSIRAIRTERGLAGKVMTKDGVLVIRWELPSGTEIDTGFRGDDKSVYPAWTHEENENS